MPRALLVDGENFKAKIVAIFKSSRHSQSRPQWHTYDFKKLFEIAFDAHMPQLRIFYFARIKEHPQTREKSKKLILEQRLLKTHLERQGFTVILSGRVRGYPENGVMTFREKGVDVKIAVDMMSFACDRIANEIVLASSDSDLQPAIHEVKKRGVECVYLGFEQYLNKGLQYTTHRTIQIRHASVLQCASSLAKRGEIS